MVCRGWHQLAGCIGMGLLILPSQVRAQSTQDLEELLGESVTKTASKTTELSSSAPAVTYNITAEDLYRFGMTSVADAINYLSTGMFSQDAPGAGPELGARGITMHGNLNAHVLVLLDGHTINDQENAVGSIASYAGIPLEIVDHIEIALGPGSVLYGSNAMLGVIHIVTKRASAYRGLHAVAEVGAVAPSTMSRQLKTPRFTSGYGSDVGFFGRTSVGGGYEFSLFGKPAEATVNVQVAGRRDPSFDYGAVPGHEVYRRRYEGSGASPSVYGQLLVGPFQLRVRALTSPLRNNVSNYDVMDSITDGAWGAAYSKGFDRWLNVDATYDTVVSRHVDVKVRVFADVAEHNREVLSYQILNMCPEDMPSGCRRSTKGNGRWLGAEVQSVVDWRGDATMQTMFGAMGVLRTVRRGLNYYSLVDNYNPGTSFPVDSVESAQAIYVQHVWRVPPALSFNVGARYDHEPRFGSRLSPRGAVVFDIWDGGTIKAIYSEAFRAPSLRETEMGDIGFRLRPDQLNAETVRSIETAYTQRVGTYRMSAGLFRTWWRDLVYSRALDDADPANAPDVHRLMEEAHQRGELKNSIERALRYTNAGSINNYGVQVSVDGSPAQGQVIYGASLAIASARISGTSSGEDLLDASPSLSGNARVAYSFGPQLPSLALAGMVLGPRMMPSPFASSGYNRPTVSTYASMRATLSGVVSFIKGLGYRASVDYVFTGATAFAGPVPPTARVAPLDPWPTNRLSAFWGLEYEVP